MARISPSVRHPVYRKNLPLMGAVLLSACAAAPKKESAETRVATYRPPTELLESASRFATPDQKLSYDFFSALLKASRIPLANLLAVPVGTGGIFLGVAQKPDGHETPFFALKDFEEQIKPHAEPFRKYYATLAGELRQEKYNSPETPKYETRCFVLPLFRGTSLDKVSMQGFVFAFELRTPEAPLENRTGLQPRRHSFEDIVQNYLDANRILPAQVLIQGRGNAQLEQVLDQLFEKK